MRPKAILFVLTFLLCDFVFSSDSPLSTTSPTSSPSGSPSTSPTPSPTFSASPTRLPTSLSPTKSPSFPTSTPSKSPTFELPTNIPATLSYFVTIRSFIAAPCRKGMGLTNLDLFCPMDATIRAMVEAGELEGHPDFQRYITPRRYLPQAGAIWPYNASFKLDAPFPLSYLNYRNPPVYTFVISALEPDSSGILKMQYCDNTTRALYRESYMCDSDYIAPKIGRILMNNDSFSTWYADSKKFNRRSGYIQTLFMTNKTTQSYRYDAANVDHNPLDNNFMFDPITQYGLNESSFPWSTFENNGFQRIGTGSCTTFSPATCFRMKYWFTSEIHTFFEYNGGERFEFTGDDDVHVFINRRMAINLGGEHSPVGRIIYLDQYTRELNLTKGEIYSFDMFHAERQTRGSNFALDTTLGQACNIVNVVDSKVNEVINWKSRPFQAQEWFLLGGPGYGFVSNETAVLMVPGIPDVLGMLFFRNAQNIGSGFTLEFSFRLSGNVGHGFSLLIHNRGLENFNSGATGPNLGVKHLERSLAVVFDACADFPDCGHSRFQVRMHYDDKGRSNDVSEKTRRVFDQDVVQNWGGDESWHTVKVYYYGKPSWLEVYVDNSLRLVQRDFQLNRVIQDESAFIGFAASSSIQGSEMKVEISNVVVRTVRIEYQNTVMVKNSTFFVADGRSEARFSLQTKDACNKFLTNGGFSNYTQGRLVLVSPQSRRRRMDSIDMEVTSLAPNAVVDNLDGTYVVKFTTLVSGTYDVYLAFGPDCGFWTEAGFSGTSSPTCWLHSEMNAMWASNFSTLAPTPFVQEEFVQIPWDVVTYTGVGLGTMMCMCCITVFLFIRWYRRRWRKDKQFIKAGEMAVMEAEMEYGNNPMGIQLVNLSQRVQKSAMELQKMRARTLTNKSNLRELEQSHDILRVNDGLKGEVLLFKRKKQMGDLEQSGPRAMSESIDKVKRKVSFKLTRASPGGGPPENQEDESWRGTNNPSFSHNEEGDLNFNHHEDEEWESTIVPVVRASTSSNPRLRPLSSEDTSEYGVSVKRKNTPMKGKVVEFADEEDMSLVQSPPPKRVGLLQVPVLEEKEGELVPPPPPKRAGLLRVPMLEEKEGEAVPPPPPRIPPPPPVRKATPPPPPKRPPFLTPKTGADLDPVTFETNELDILSYLDICNVPVEEQMHICRLLMDSPLYSLASLKLATAEELKMVPPRIAKMLIAQQHTIDSTVLPLVLPPPLPSFTPPPPRNGGIRRTMTRSVHAPSASLESPLPPPPPVLTDSEEDEDHTTEDSPRRISIDGSDQKSMIQTEQSHSFRAKKSFRF